MGRTGLTSLFDIKSLSFSNERLTSGSQVPWREPAPSESAVNTLSGLPTIFAALKKVGLRLKSGMGPVEVLVIDNLERPSEN
ncbi:MAG: TIGR03435 family protein [Acidobacteria bacterium]|nr:TIGR03435 family protein [Acidobacteriota bacterium]